MFCFFSFLSSLPSISFSPQIYSSNAVNMVATTPEPCINLESLFDFNDNNNHGFKFIVDGNNHGFRFIIIECYVSSGKPHHTPCRQNLHLHFSPLHVLERSTTTSILQQAPAVKVGVEVQYPLQGGEIRRKTTDNNNLMMLNNDRDLSKIKW